MSAFDDSDGEPELTADALSASTFAALQEHLAEVEAEASALLTVRTGEDDASKEAELATAFDLEQARRQDEERRQEAERFHELEVELLQRLEDALKQRADFLEEMRTIGDGIYKRRMQELSADVATLRMKVDAAEAVAMAKEEWAAQQLNKLKEAFRGDVHAMAKRLDELRAENVKQARRARPLWSRRL